jgi:mitochondrial fission process protein 1
MMQQAPPQQSMLGSMASTMASGMAFGTGSEIGHQAIRSMVGGSSSSHHVPGNNESEKDIWRETSLRYLGYANEVGEAFGPIFPKYVRPSYAVAFGYVGCDTADKTWKSIKRGESGTATLKTSADALIWQTFASVLIPGKVINLITNSSANMLKSQSFARLPIPIRTWAPTAIGLATIPFIIHPIDHAVDYVMDNTLRKMM